MARSGTPAAQHGSSSGCVVTRRPGGVGDRSQGNIVSSEGACSGGARTLHRTPTEGPLVSQEPGSCTSSTTWPSSTKPASRRPTMVLVLDGPRRGHAAGLASSTSSGSGTGAVPWSRRSTSTSSTTTAPGVPRCRSCATTTRGVRRAPALVRLLHDSGGTPYLLLQGLEPTTAGRPSRVRCARSSSGSASVAWSAWARCRWRCRTRGRSRSPTMRTTPS